MTDSFEDEDWTSEIEITEPTPALKIKAHDLFDPIWREDQSASREQAYRALAEALGVDEHRAHFKRMPRDRLLRAIRLLPALRETLAARRTAILSKRLSGTRKGASASHGRP